MRRRTLLLALMTMTVIVSACGGGGGIRPRLFAPTLSVQELAVDEAGGWTLKLRLQNFSNVPMTLSAVDARLRVDGIDAGALRFEPTLDVGPESAEIYGFELAPSPDAAERVRSALLARRGVSYEVEGEIRSTAPSRRRDSFTFQSQLSAVPGLAGVMR